MTNHKFMVVDLVRQSVDIWRWHLVSNLFGKSGANDEQEQIKIIKFHQAIEKIRLKDYQLYLNCNCLIAAVSPLIIMQRLFEWSSE